jgi:hypothetical protein
MIAADPIHGFTEQDSGGAHRRAGDIERNAKNRRQIRARTLIATRTARCHECPVLRVRGAPFHCGSMLRAAFPHRSSGDQNGGVSGGNESWTCRPNHRERTGSARDAGGSPRGREPTAWANARRLSSRTARRSRPPAAEARAPVSRNDGKAPLARHLPDRVGETHGPGGGGVSFCVPGVRRRYPADRIHHRTSADSEGPHASGRTAPFTPGSRTILRTRPPLTSSDREYTPARSADRHRPEAHCRNPSILSPAVTATGATFCGA